MLLTKTTETCTILTFFSAPVPHRLRVRLQLNVREVLNLQCRLRSPRPFFPPPARSNLRENLPLPGHVVFGGPTFIFPLSSVWMRNGTPQGLPYLWLSCSCFPLDHDTSSPTICLRKPFFPFFPSKCCRIFSLRQRLSNYPIRPS